MDSWTRSLELKGEIGMVGKRTDICKSSACGRFLKILHRMRPIQKRMERKGREGPWAGVCPDSHQFTG